MGEIIIGLLVILIFVILNFSHKVSDFIDNYHMQMRGENQSVYGRLDEILELLEKMRYIQVTDESSKKKIKEVIEKHSKDIVDNAGTSTQVYD